MEKKAIRYIRSIKNREKKRYAQDYWRGIDGEPYKLLYMTKQAVRFMLDFYRERL